MRSLMLALATLLAATPAFARPMVEVNTCGQAIPQGALGYLTANLDCTGYTGAPGAVQVLNNGVFDLRGFTLTTDAVFGVYCGGLEPNHGGSNPCTVTNGKITGGQTGHAIIGKRVRASHLVIDGAAVMGIVADGPFIGEDLQISGCGSCGVRAAKAMRVSDSTITANGEGGLCSGKAIRLFDSAVTGNGTDAECSQGAPHCADLDSAKRPVLKDSTCGTSLGKPFSQNGFDWDVCTLD